MPCPLLGWPYGPLPALASLLAALAWDRLQPEARGLLLRIHPTVTAYRMARAVALHGESVAWGLLAWAATLTVHLAAWGLLLCLAARQGPLGWALASTLLARLSMGDQLLYDTVRGVAGSLQRGDLAMARRLASTIVRRDTSVLGPGHVASAALESLAENLVDAYTSPLLYYVLLGPLGSLAQRVVNAMDSALGYREPPYDRLGLTSAHADTLLNMVPARLTALAIAAAAPLAAGSLREALSCLRRSRGTTLSPNHWPPMGALAGSLRVSLEKKGSYTICPGRPLPGSLDVVRGIRLAALAGSIYTLLVLSVGVIVWNYQPL